MPVDNITVNRNASSQSQQLASLIDTLYSARASARRILEQMQQQTDLSSSYTAIEQQYGLQAGQGSVVYGLVFALANGAGSGSGLENSAITAFCSRLNY